MASRMVLKPPADEPEEAPIHITASKNGIRHGAHSI